MEVSHAYAALGLSPGASANDVRHAYRGAVRRLHPDTGSGDVPGLTRVTDAYRTIESVLPARTPDDAIAARSLHVDVYA